MMDVSVVDPLCASRCIFFRVQDTSWPEIRVVR